MKKTAAILTALLLAGCTTGSSVVHRTDEVSFDELNKLITYPYSSKSSFIYVQPQMNIDVAKSDTTKFEREYRTMYQNLIGSDCDNASEKLAQAQSNAAQIQQALKDRRGAAMGLFALGCALNQVTCTVYQAETGISNKTFAEVERVMDATGMFNAFGIKGASQAEYNQAQSTLRQAIQTERQCNAKFNKHGNKLFAKIQAQAKVCENHKWFKNYSGSQLSQLCKTAVSEDFISRFIQYSK